MRPDCAGCGNQATDTVDGIPFCDACGPEARHWHDREADLKRAIADHYLTNHPELRTHHDIDSH